MIILQHKIYYVGSVTISKINNLIYKQSVIITWNGITDKTIVERFGIPDIIYIRHGNIIP